MKEIISCVILTEVHTETFLLWYCEQTPGINILHIEDELHLSLFRAF